MLLCADIQFWRSRKSLEGLSVRSVFFNVFQSLIVLLYVIDNETNTIVKISIFVGLCIELWKIHKVVNIQVSVHVCMGRFYSDKNPVYERNWYLLTEQRWKVSTLETICSK